MGHSRRLGTRLLTLAALGWLLALTAWPAGSQGRTQVTFRGDPGEFVTGGKRYVYTPRNAKISLQGSRGLITMRILAPRRTGSEEWYMTASSGAHQLLRRGITYHATRYPFSFSGPGAGFDLSGLSHGCNELKADFRIVHWRLLKGSIRSLSFAFVQYCEARPPALHGRVDWRV